MTFAAVEAIGETILLLSFVVGIALHEMGHAVGAWAAGLRVRLVSLGSGRALCHLRLGGVIAILRLAPISGYVTIEARLGMSRGEICTMLVGGPLANAVLLGLAVAVEGWITDPYGFLVPVALSQALLLLGSLVPYQGRWQASDGLQLLNQLRERAPSSPFARAYVLMMRPVLPEGAEVPMPSPVAWELIWQLTRRDRLLDAWGTRDAQAALLSLLHGGLLSPVERVVTLTFLAANEVLFGGTGADPAQLDAWSAEAVRASDRPGPSITRAAVLVRLGRAAEAEALLRPFTEAELDIADRLFCLLAMAQATASLGRRAEAAEWLQAARGCGKKGAQRRRLGVVVKRAMRLPPLAGLA